MEQDKEQKQEQTLVITKGEFLEKKKELLEQDRDKRREDSKGQDRSNWGKFNKKGRKRNGRKKDLTQEQKQDIRQVRRDRNKIKKALEQELKKLQGGNKDNEEKDEKNEIKERRFNKREYKQEYLKKIQDAPRVVVDFQFVDQIMERDRASLMKQVEVCYSENRQAEKPLKLTCAQGEHELMQKYIETRSARNWGIDYEPKDILEAYNKDDLIYLSGDVDVDMDEYDPTKTYVIGGLVEHNRLINLTKNYSAKHGIKARRLPLDRYLDLCACHLLNINHVFSILLKLHNGESWEKAITTSVPKRKIGDIYFDSDNEEKEEEILEKIEKKQKTEGEQEQKEQTSEKQEQKQE